MFWRSVSWVCVCLGALGRPRDRDRDRDRDAEKAVVRALDELGYHDQVHKSADGPSHRAPRCLHQRQTVLGCAGRVRDWEVAPLSALDVFKIQGRSEKKLKFARLAVLPCLASCCL